MTTWDRSEGHWLVCDCGRSALLPYTNDTRTAVYIGNAEGWTTPPLRCPECSEMKQRNVLIYAGKGPPKTGTVQIKTE